MAGSGDEASGGRPPRLDFSWWPDGNREFMRPGPVVPEPRLRPEDVAEKLHYGLPVLGRYLAVEVLRGHGEMPTGYRGYLLMPAGDLYDLHVELPVDGRGVPVDDVAVVELDEDGRELVTRYREWVGRLGVTIVCPRCRDEIAPGGGGRCRPMERAIERAAARHERQDRRERERRAWAREHPEVEVPVLASPLQGARELRSGLRGRARAERRARGYSLDFRGVHVVDQGKGSFAVFATERRPRDGDEPGWPIPVLG